MPGKTSRLSNPVLDNKDVMLIEELRNDSKLSEQKLAGRTGIPMTTVHNRLRKLRGLGVIRKYTVSLDYAKLGRPLVAYVLVKAVPGADQKELFTQIAGMPNVCETALVAGDFDLLFKVRAASMDELNGMLAGGLRKQKTVGDARTAISYETMENP